MLRYRKSTRNSCLLSKTRMAKSVLDAGWSQLRKMLQYKCDDAGSIFQVVNEAYSTQECSHCHSLTGPKGQSGLNERNWVCSACGAAHDRDVNAARNILARGLQELGKELSVAVEANACEPTTNKGPVTGDLARVISSGSAVGRDRPVEGIPVLTASQRQPQG